MLCHLHYCFWFSRECRCLQSVFSRGTVFFLIRQSFSRITASTCAFGTLCWDGVLWPRPLTCSVRAEISALILTRDPALMSTEIPSPGGTRLLTKTLGLRSYRTS